MSTRRAWWYRTLGRPVFFALPPEAAHDVALAALGLPLPWARIAGAGRAGSGAGAVTAGISFGTLSLRNPIGLAAGFDKGCRRLDVLGELGFGYVVGGTVTRAARRGNPAPRIARSPRSRSMVNAMGLPNPGAEAVAATLRDHAPGPARRFVSVADEDLPDAVSSLELLEPFLDGVELNASCPNVGWGRDRDDETHLRQLVEAFRSRTTKPLTVKLPPFLDDVSREAVLALARIARDAGADGITCSNTRPVADARLSVGRGGLSGRALWPHTPRVVAEVRAALGDRAVINACGGVFTPSDVARCLDSGATTVQIYTALIYEGPGVVGRLASRPVAP